jgi:hypothetical protein
MAWVKIVKVVQVKQKLQLDNKQVIMHDQVRLDHDYSSLADAIVEWIIKGLSARGDGTWTAGWVGTLSRPP